MTNQNQLKKRLESIYTFSYWKYSYEVENISFEDKTEDLECIVEITIKTTEWKTKVEYNQERKRDEERIDTEHPKVVNTFYNTISLVVPLSDNQLLDINGKDRVQINSARYRPLLKFYNKSARCGGLYFKFDDDVNGTIEFNNGYSVSLPFLCLHFGIFKDVYPQLNIAEFTRQFEELSTDDKNEFKEQVKILEQTEIPPRLLCKIKVVSHGKINLKSTKYDKDFLKFVISIILGNYTGSEDIIELTKGLNEPTPMEFLFMDSISGLCYELGLNTQTIRMQIKHDFGKSQTIKPTVIQSKIDSYYRMQAEDFRDVQVSKDSNALSTMSQGHTIYFYDKDKDTQSWEKMQLYNKYFVGVLDPTRTRDGNLNNVNNELALCTRIEEDNVFITLIDKKTKKDVELSYEEYIVSKVLSVENYKNGKIIPNKNGRYTYCQYGDYKETTDISDVKYIRKAYNLMSYATATVPFADRQVSTRTLMASHFLDQSTPVIGAKPAIVHTKMNKWIYENSPHNVKADCDGVVTDIYDGYIKVSTTEGKTRILGRGKYFNTSMHTSNEYTLDVKVGDKFHKGQILAHTNSFVDGEFTTQVPLYVCYGTYMAQEHEDGIVLTESAAKKFGHISYITVDYDFDNKYTYKFFKNRPGSKYYNADFDEWCMIKAGSKVKRGDNLFTVGRVLMKHYKNSLAKAVGDENKKVFYQEVFNVKVPYDVIEGGEVVSANLYINNNDQVWGGETPMLDYNDVEHVANAYDYFEAKQKAENKRFKQFFGSKPDEYDFGGYKKPRTGMHLSVVIRYTNTMGEHRLGGKLSNFYASKGVNTYIIPDKYAPTDEFGNTIECFVSSLSTYSRTNPGQIDEVKLGLVGYEAWKRLIKDADKPTEKITKFLDVLYPNGWDWKQLKSDGNKYGYIRIEVDEFDNYYNHESITKMLKMLGLGNGDSRIYLPEFKKKTEYPCTVGITSMMRLHFIQETKTSYTAEGSFTVVEDNDNIWYRNGEREGGQKVGAQEVWANIAHGLDNLMLKDAVKNDNKNAQVTAAFLMLGMKLRKR